MNVSFIDSPHPAESVPLPLPDITHPLVICMGLVFLLVAWLAIDRVRSILRARQRKAKALVEANRQPPAASPPHFASQEHAKAVFELANVNYYQYLLAELRSSLSSEGYDLTRDRERQVPLTQACESRIARAILVAREHYNAPRQADALLEERMHQCVRDGYALQWLKWLISGSELQGWFITRNDAPDV